MNKQQMKKKIFEVQNMGELELKAFAEKLSTSDLATFKKELLFKAIDIRRNRHLEIADALVAMGDLEEWDENEL